MWLFLLIVASFLPAEGNRIVTTGNTIDGNRVISGSIDLLSIEPIILQLGSPVLWVVGRQTAEGGTWLAVLEGGSHLSVTLEKGVPNILPMRSGPSFPPVLWTKETAPESLYLGNFDTYPLLLPDLNATIHITSDGQLLLRSDNELIPIYGNVLHDSRVVSSGGDALVVLASPTTRYPHGILGDRWEAGSILVVQFRQTTSLSWETKEIGLSDKVFEMTTPMLADIDQDGTKDIVTTVSDATSGSQIVVYAKNGDVIAESEPIGKGFRWLHQIAYGPFGPEGQRELVVVRTPHIGGFVQYMRNTLGSLETIYQKAGYSTHVISSRNLDMALGGDFDGDQKLELLIPNQALTTLYLLNRTQEGGVAEKLVHLPSQISSNVSAVQTGDRIRSVALGTQGGELLIWFSP